MAESSEPRPFETWASAATIRSRVVLEIAAELVGAPDQPMRQARVLLRSQGKGDWPLALHGGSTLEAIHQVVSGEAQLSMVNPAAMLALAWRGTGPFTASQPLRTIGVIPSLDSFVFAVRKDLPIETFEDIGRLRFPLRVCVRDQPDHCIHLMLEHVCAAAGFSVRDLAGWGGALHHAVSPRGPRWAAYDAGEADAIFDEALEAWGEEALARGMKFLPLGPGTLAKLEAMGYRRSVISAGSVAGLSADVVTLDFSGWPVYVRDDLPDPLVEQICAALDARKHLIPWQGVGPLPVERMARDAPDTPLDVPLHPAAERAWRARGYLG